MSAAPASRAIRSPSPAALRRAACPSAPSRPAGLRPRGRAAPVSIHGAQKATLSAICGITSRSFGSRSLNESSRQNLVVPRAPLGEGREQRLGLDAAPRVEGGGERPVPALVHQALLDVDDRRHLRHRPRPGIGVVVGRVRRWSRRRGRCRPSSTSAPPSAPRSAGPAAPGRPRSSRRTRGRRSSAPRRRRPAPPPSRARPPRPSSRSAISISACRRSGSS